MTLRATMTSLMLAGLAALLFACLPVDIDPRASQSFGIGETLHRDEFDAPGAWQTYDTSVLRLGVVNGAYRAELSTAAYVWGLNPFFTHDDAMIEADILLIEGGARDSGYGVICRGDPANDGDGYYFLLGADGTYSIRRGRGNAVEPLIPWERSGAIRQGVALNRIQALCLGDYLALFVNGQFVAETRDSLYRRGIAGVGLVALPNAQLVVQFDNLTVREAFPGP